MSNTSLMSGKAFYRLRQQLADVQLGRLPDIGEKHAKGHRFRLGKDAKDGNARFWLGQVKREAQQRAAALIETWAGIVKTGGPCWTPQALEQYRQPPLVQERGFGRKGGLELPHA